jgi:cytidyltransferase-like protein
MNVVVSGTFDLFHHGHRNLLRLAHEIAGDDILFVFVNTDGDVGERKTLAESQEERELSVEKFLNEWRDEDSLVVTTGYREMLRSFFVQTNEEGEEHIFLHGDDWGHQSLSEHYGVPEEFWVENGVTLLFTPRTPGISSSDLRQ